MKVFYCLNCRRVHVIDPDNFISCPDCGGEVALTNLTPKEWDEMSGEEQYRIRKYLIKQERSLKAPKKRKLPVFRIVVALVIGILFILLCTGILIISRQL
ncbi:MAG: hypothetical protein IJ641_09090 [Lachnospiraceae bacterium]|nr:hypothetical protein [Lachnospiraceae bacterium]